MGGEPSLGAGYEFVGFGCGVVAHELGLAMLVAHPEDGIVRVGVDSLVVYALLVHEGQGVYDGEELADVVGATNGAEMEDLRPCGQVDALVFHRSWVSGTGSVHRPRVCSHLRRQGQHGVVAIVGRRDWLVTHDSVLCNQRVRASSPKDSARDVSDCLFPNQHPSQAKRWHPFLPFSH